jgi:hypothetical protein
MDWLDGAEEEFNSSSDNEENNRPVGITAGIHDVTISKCYQEKIDAGSTILHTVFFKDHEIIVRDGVVSTKAGKNHYVKNGKKSLLLEVQFFIKMHKTLGIDIKKAASDGVFEQLIGQKCKIVVKNVPEYYNDKYHDVFKVIAILDTEGKNDRGVESIDYWSKVIEESTDDNPAKPAVSKPKRATIDDIAKEAVDEDGESW